MEAPSPRISGGSGMASVFECFRVRQCIVLVVWGLAGSLSQGVFGQDCNGNGVPDDAEIHTNAVQCDGAGDYIRVPGHASYSFGAGDFTIEMWVRPDVLAGDHRVLFCNE